MVAALWWLVGCNCVLWNAVLLVEGDLQLEGQ